MSDKLSDLISNLSSIKKELIGSSSIDVIKKNDDEDGPTPVDMEIKRPKPVKATIERPEDDSADEPNKQRQIKDIAKAEECEEILKFEKNGQWKLENK
jgi:hypothetical protein